MAKILVIEDEKNILENMLELLQLENFEVTGAENGLVGVQLAKQIVPDLIICDLLMPELDGYGVLKALRTEPLTAMIPFIFMTAQTRKPDIHLGVDLEPDNYITKPCKIVDLLSAIAIQLERR